jgi:dTDP-D-glucose 4,6-dehydratase
MISTTKDIPNFENLLDNWHDLRYAIDATKLKEELGLKSSLQFEEGI